MDNILIETLEKIANELNAEITMTMQNTLDTDPPTTETITMKIGGDHNATN